MFKLVKNTIDVDTYLELRQKVGWKKLTRKQAEMALSNSLITVLAVEDDEPIGMGRIVGDGAVISYIQDLIVVPSVQKKGIGSAIIKELISFVDSITMEDSEMMLCLMCAKGREAFYEKHSFIARPNDNLGPGMIQYIRHRKSL